MTPLAAGFGIPSTPLRTGRSASEINVEVARFSSLSAAEGSGREFVDRKALAACGRNYLFKESPN
jgi:hypothetical protein